MNLKYRKVEQVTERLTEIINDRNAVKDGICGTIGNSGRYFIGKAIDKLSEYETAEEEGRLVVLPCNLGTPVYFLRHGFDGWRIDSRKFVYGMIGEVGETVFLTKEEAEKALKEMKEKQSE